jgi:hypothetical protein
MKRIIKLTESDITRVVKRIIKEEKSSKQDVLKKHVLKNGWEDVAERIGGFDNLYKHAFNNDYNEFLNLFNNFEVVQSEQRPNWMLYRFEKGNNMMIYDKENEDVYINYDVIWLFFRRGIGLNYNEIQGIMKKWLDEVYNLRGITPANVSMDKIKQLDEVYNLIIVISFQQHIFKKINRSLYL